MTSKKRIEEIRKEHQEEIPFGHRDYYDWHNTTIRELLVYIDELEKERDATKGWNEFGDFVKLCKKLNVGVRL